MADPTADDRRRQAAVYAETERERRIERARRMARFAKASYVLGGVLIFVGIVLWAWGGVGLVGALAPVAIGVLIIVTAVMVATLAANTRFVRVVDGPDESEG